MALLAIGLIVVLFPSAYASPPDPSWIAGLYDDSDHDDAILAVESLCANLVETGPRLDFELRLVERTLSTIDASTRTDPYSPRPYRGPPARTT